MRCFIAFLFYCSVAVFLSYVPVLAEVSQGQEPSPSAQPVDAKTVQTFQRIIDEQQNRLDVQQLQLEAQQEQLKEQNRALQELRRQMQAIAGVQQPEAPLVSTKREVPTSENTTPRRTDTQVARGDKEHPEDQWKGSFAVDGINTRVKIGGFAELDIIHDTDAIGSKGQFVTSTIITRNETKTDGSDGQTNFSVSPSRLHIETHTPISQHRLKTFLSIDFFGKSMDVQPDPRMRKAYGELSNILFGGDLLVGQAWSTFSDLEAYPNVLDFQGPNSFFGTRQPMIRWSKGLADGLKLMVAAETPNNHIIQGADSLTSWPDGVFSMDWANAPFHLMGSIVARDLRASYNNGPTETAFGWGGSFSGKVAMPFFAEKDILTFSATYGEGIGSNFNDQPPDIVFDSTGTNFEVIPVFGWFVSYEHWWNSQFSSTLVYGALDVDNQATQSMDSLDTTQYAAANAVWKPNEHWLLGVEALWGKREDLDGEDGTDFRTQFTSRFIF